MVKLQPQSCPLVHRHLLKATFSSPLLFCLYPSSWWRWTVSALAWYVYFCTYQGTELIRALIVFSPKGSWYLSTIRQQQKQWWWLIEAVHMTALCYHLGKSPWHHHSNAFLSYGKACLHIRLWVRYHNHIEFWLTRGAVYENKTSYISASLEN